MTRPQQNPFWDYSLAHYARPEVARCCLGYQERLGANVNLLLFCCWLGHCGELLSAETLKQAESQIACWDEQVVQPLRKVRRFANSSEHHRDRELVSAVHELESRLRQVELMAEQLVQDTLYLWWKQSWQKQGWQKQGWQQQGCQQQGVQLQNQYPIEKSELSHSGIEASGISLQLKNLNNYLALLGGDEITNLSPLVSPLVWPRDSTWVPD